MAQSVGVEDSEPLVERLLRGEGSRGMWRVVVAAALLTMGVLGSVIGTPAWAQGSAEVTDPTGDAQSQDGSSLPGLDVTRLAVVWGSNTLTVVLDAAGPYTYEDYAEYYVEFTLDGAENTYIRARTNTGQLAVSGPDGRSCAPQDTSWTTSYGGARQAFQIATYCLVPAGTSALDFTGTVVGRWASANGIQWSADSTGRKRIGHLPAPPETHIPVNRIAGSDRVATALAIADRFDFSTETVLLARADDYADALAAAPLAAALGAPVLLTPAQPDERVRDFIARTAPDRLVVVGGPAAIPGSVAEAYRGGARITRIAGDTRWDTAHLLAAKLAAALEADALAGAVLVEGANADPTRGWPDAVAASAFAGSRGFAIVPTLHDQLPAESARTLSRLLGSGATLTVVGGRTAISAEVVEDAEQAAGASAQLLSGADRYNTSAAVADQDPDARRLLVVTGRDYPDALTAGAAAGAADVVVLFTQPDSFLTPSAWLDRHGCAGRAIDLIGGTAAISADVEYYARVRAAQDDCEDPA